MLLHYSYEEVKVMIFLGLTSTMKNTLKPNHTPAIDEQLLFRIAEGDTGALSALYAETSSAVYGFALSILKDAHSAEDVMQDTYLKIYTAAGSYAAKGKPMAWILTIVKNLSLMKLRQNRKLPDVPLDESWDISDPKDRFAESQDKILLQAVLKALTEEERQIVTLYAVSGLKHREIASLLDLPLPTVLSKYRRALNKMRRFMGDEFNEK